MKQRDYLRRLDPSFYKGRAYVHWTMTLADRSEGWLTEAHFHAFRERLLHVLVRYRICSPVYCLMPDHAHCLFMGLSEHSDQLKAVACLRREWNRLLRPAKLQKQAYDHVLRESERARGAFADMVGYILRNPQRKGLVEHWQEWRYTDCCFPGYPRLDPRDAYFWDNFWRAVHEQSD
ncbi:MAG: hypothetical protein ACPG3X_07750 [Opitutales bacterium]